MASEELTKLSVENSPASTPTPEPTTTSTGPSDALKEMSIALSPKTTPEPPPINRRIVSQGTTRGGGTYTQYSDKSYEVQEADPAYLAAQKQAEKEAQREINAINKYANDQISALKPRQDERLRENAAINTLTGLAGSTEANVTTERTSAINKKEADLVRSEAAMKVQNVLGKVSDKALAIAKNNREAFTLDQEQKEKQRVQDATDVMTLAQSGVDIDKFKTANPEEYSYLAESLGGEEMLKAHFVLNRPQETILDKKIQGGKYMVAYKNPISGAIRIETVDLGLPPEYSNTLDAGDRILAVPDGWDGDVTKLITINKGLTPGQAKTVVDPNNSGTYGNDLEAVVGNVYNMIPSKNGKEAFQASISRARNDKDKIDAIASVVLRNSPAEVRRDFTNQGIGIGQIEKAIKIIDEGVKTGALQAGAQYAFNLVGKDYDPKLAAISAYLTGAIQPYRNSVTGAAWGTQEDGEYQQLFGSTKYEPTELRERLVRVKEILRDKSAAALNTQVSPIGGFDLYSEYDGAGGARAIAEAAGYDYDAMIAEGYSDEQITSAIQGN